MINENLFYVQFALLGSCILLLSFITYKLHVELKVMQNQISLIYEQAIKKIL